MTIVIIITMMIVFLVLCNGDPTLPGARSQDWKRERPKGWLLLRILHGQHRLFMCCFCFRDIPRYDIYRIYIYVYVYAVYLLVCVCIHMCMCKKVYECLIMLKYNDLTTCRHWNELTTRKVFSDLTHTNAARLEMQPAVWRYMEIQQMFDLGVGRDPTPNTNRPKRMMAMKKQRKQSLSQARIRCENHGW